MMIHQFLLQFPADEEWKYNLGILLQGLSLSYIAAFLFFIVHDYYPHFLTKKKYQPIIDRELSNLWEICNSLTYSMSKHSGVKVYYKSENFEESVAEQLRNLPVQFNKDVKEENIDSEDISSKTKHPLPPDEEFDKKDKPIIIREMGFDKWSDAIEYTTSNISLTLNKVLKMKDIVKEETVIKIFDLERSISDFRIVAKIYEESHNKTFKNGYLEQVFVKFYEGTEELKDYNKRHKDPKNFL
ncbi:hypothetical protein [Halobacillus trueperi]|uniref:hypothetical protein n=1 Tax=Halobacillus trueperi TaxID=156205 RepID=UPI0011C05393|nr:hypothetical protein [Halobacillus trueperi]